MRKKSRSSGFAVVFFCILENFLEMFLLLKLTWPELFSREVTVTEKPLHCLGFFLLVLLAVYLSGKEVYNS